MVNKHYRVLDQHSYKALEKWENFLLKETEKHLGFVCFKENTKYSGENDR